MVWTPAITDWADKSCITAIIAEHFINAQLVASSSVPQQQQHPNNSHGGRHAAQLLGAGACGVLLVLFAPTGPTRQPVNHGSLGRP
jgi:hypothetical protein